jgi:hypothetical protein
VGAPAVECSETEHEFSEFERLREVVVGAEFEPGGLVVETSAAVSMRIGMPLSEATMRLAISSPEGPGISRSRTAMS